MGQTQTHTQDQRSNSEQLEVNAKLFSVIRKSNISEQGKVKKFKKLFGKKPQPDINTQDGNDNWNTALHLAIERNELEVVNFLLSQGADTAIKNGARRTPLELAAEFNHAGIINELKRCTSPVQWPPSWTDILPSHNSQPAAASHNEVPVFNSNSHAAVTGKEAASTVHPPFTDKLRVDNKLKWRDEYFKKSIEDFLEEEKLSAIHQIKATPHYPTPHVLAQFADIAYHDCKQRDPEPPNGWLFLTTASNRTNGYFGTAYWHPKHQQVVIAHRGTEKSKPFAFLKDFLADVKGVYGNKFVGQMNSANTFANQVVTVIQEIEQEKEVTFELFFTGHSLGGWLAQIAAFTTEYLEVKGGAFLKKLKTQQGEQHASSTVQDRHDVRDSYHPHTVVFESPGCKDMLSQMADELDVRNDGRYINIEHLDITSYLSAPNRINTCNKHVGTVYRIFPALSDMGWWKKNTPLYNLATHSMDKIVLAFDPETGQVYKDEQGVLKVQVAVDWPVSEGITGGKEWNDFFKWAEQLNNYHTEVMDISCNRVPKGYHPLCYQTKAYDECTKSLSVFTKDVREFLERYRWFRRLPEFFKPEDLFCVMNDAEAQKEAERELNELEIGNESVRCQYASTLHALILYVKRLITLFPLIKKNLEDQLSSPKIKRFCQHETQRYVEKICHSALDFNPSALGLKEFLTSDKQIWLLRMTAGDAWTGITKVYQVLQNTNCCPNYSSEGHYTILDLETLQTVSQMINLKSLVTEKDEPHLLMIACGTDQPINNELRHTFRELISILENKKEMKIILTTQSEDSTIDFQQIASKTLGKRVKTTDETVTWNELTANSQREMFEKKVIFQGVSVALNKLTSAESVTDSFPLADLLQGAELRIGEEPSTSGDYNENYYIDRTFNHNIVIRQDILNDKRQGKFADLLARTEQEFEQLCQQNTMSNVHWLEKGNSGDLIWQQSQGNLQTLRKYIEAHKSQSYSPSELDRLLQQSKNQRVMIIADKAGMGKTTVLTHLSKRIKQKYPAHWLVRIDLNNYTELLEAQKRKKLDKGRVLEFVSKEVLKLESDLEKELFKKCFEENATSKVVVMVDGFDEISPSYKETVLDMLHVLKQTSLEQLWVTTRTHLREELEDNLEQLSYTLQPFSEVEQVEFIMKFWLQKLNSDNMDHDRLQIYAKALIKNLAESISDKYSEFTGIPLQTRMIAEAYQLSEETVPVLLQKLELVELYRQFIDRKYNIYYEEKCKTPAGNVGVTRFRPNICKQLQKTHELLALEALFTEDQITFLQSYKDSTFSDEDLAGVGIVQRNDGKPHFIHRTFAEYYVAEFLINHLTDENKPHPQVQEFLVSTILLRRDCQVIRAFLNGLLRKCSPKKEALKEYEEKLDELWDETEVNGVLVGSATALHIAARENTAHIIGLLLDSLQSGDHSNATIKMLLAKDDKGRTAWHMAAENDSVEALGKMWEWAEVSVRRLVQSKGEKLNVTTLRDKLLRAIDWRKYTTAHRTARDGRMEVMEALWKLDKDGQLNTERLLSDQSNFGYTTWKMAVKELFLEVLKKHWVWANEVQPNPNVLKKILLLDKDKYGYTAWHRAAERGNFEALETLWCWAKEVEINPEILFLDKNSQGDTTWHSAAKKDRLAVLKKLWVWANEVQPNPKALKKKLLLDKGCDGYAVWHRAARKGNIEALETFLSWAKEAEINPEILLLDEDHWGHTAWQSAAKKLHLAVLKKLWVWANEVQPNPNALKEKLLLDKDSYGYTVWHRALKKQNVEALETLWSWAKEVEINPEELLLTQIGKGYTARQKAADSLHLEVLKETVGLGKKSDTKSKNAFTNRDRIVGGFKDLQIGRAIVGILKKIRFWRINRELKKYELGTVSFLAQYEGAVTVWDNAASRSHKEVLNKMFVFAREAKLNSYEVKYSLLLSKDDNGNTPWHQAAERGSLEALETLCVWCKEVGINPVKVRNKLLLARNKFGETAWEIGDREVTEKLSAIAIEAEVNSRTYIKSSWKSEILKYFFLILIICVNTYFFFLIYVQFGLIFIILMFLLGFLIKQNLSDLTTLFLKKW